MGLISAIPNDTVKDLYANQNNVLHMGDLPSLHLMEPWNGYTTGNYAVTMGDGKTLIAQHFFERLTEIEEDTVEFVHASFFLAVVLLHEASHAKVRPDSE